MSRPPQKPTIEELLRLKRAERPADEFWARFDAGLRAKQLAALVEKPSWLVLLRARLARLAAPFGAVAACALALATWLGHRPTLPMAASAPPPMAAATAPAATDGALALSAPMVTAFAAVVVPVEIVSISPSPETVVAAADNTPAVAPPAIDTPFAFASANEPVFVAIPLPVTVADPVFPADFAGLVKDLVASYTPALLGLAPVPAVRTRPQGETQVGEKLIGNLDEEKLFPTDRRVVALDGGRVSVKFW